MEFTLHPPATAALMCSVASPMSAHDGVLNNDPVEQEECSVMESPKRESSEWTDEKHSLYLKSMEASFVDQLYNSLDMRSWQTQNECLSDSVSSRKIQASTRYPSGEFKVLQHGFWSRIDFKRENLVHNEANRPHFSSSNPWIQHFRNRNKHEATESLSPNEKSLFISCSNTEVIDQNFVEEDSAVQKVITPCRKKRKSTSAPSGSNNDQVASFWRISCNRDS